MAFRGVVFATVIPLVTLVTNTLQAGEQDWSGYGSIEPRLFVDSPLFPQQPPAGISLSAVIAPEFRYDWNQGDDRITIAPYLRWDENDDERSHWDLREASWLHVGENWTMLAGLGSVFWGVTESRHLVDIINQTDQVDDINEEDKLGQPMISLERWTEAGSFTVYFLPGFRERTFPAANARLRGALPIDTERVEYESGARDRRLDWALRWSHSIGNWDIGVSGFRGTSREPSFLPRLDVAGNPVLVPRYDIISQIGIDLQYTRGGWLWKVETMARRGHGDSFAAIVAGFEYTLFGLKNSGADLGLLAEYLFDGRDLTAPPTIYEDGWFSGFRLALNDTEDTAILAGAIVGAEGTFAIVEAERRLGEYWKLELEARALLDVNPTDPILGGYRNDSFVTLRLARFW